MGGDEAVALIAIAARADIGDAYAPDGTLLPVAQWPEALRLAVKSIKLGPCGESITLQDALRARELIAAMSGKLKRTAELLHTFDHATWLEGLDDPKGPTT